jgi:hypothetical protein
MSKLKTPARVAKDVAQISNLLDRRFAIGKRSNAPDAQELSGNLQVENLGYSRLEIYARRMRPTPRAGLA